MGTPSINMADTGSWCNRRFVAHHRTSVLSELSCNLLDFIQAATSPMHPAICDESTFMAAGEVCVCFAGVGWARHLPPRAVGFPVIAAFPQWHLSAHHCIKTSYNPFREAECRSNSSPRRNDSVGEWSHRYLLFPQPPYGHFGDAMLVWRQAWSSKTVCAYCAL